MGRNRDIGEGQTWRRDSERLGRNREIGEGPRPIGKRQRETEERPRDSLGQTQTDREETAGDRGETERLGSDREIGKRPRDRGGTEIGKRQRETGERPER